MIHIILTHAHVYASQRLLVRKSIACVDVNRCTALLYPCVMCICMCLDRQLAAVRGLVNSLDLMKGDDDGYDVEALKPELTFNPVEHKAAHGVHVMADRTAHVSHTARALMFISHAIVCQVLQRFYQCVEK